MKYDICQYKIYNDEFIPNDAAMDYTSPHVQQHTNTIILQQFLLHQ